MRTHHDEQGRAANSGSPTGTQSAAIPDLLRQSLRRVLADGRAERSEQGKLRIALRDVCERARRDGVRAEHLLMVLKESWRDLPERAEVPRHDADDVLARLVSACIDEYYEDPTTAESDSPSRCIREAERLQALPPSGEMQ